MYCNKPTRRTFLVGAAALGSAGLVSKAQAQSGPLDAKRSLFDRAPFPVYALPERITFGLNRHEMAKFDELGHADYLEYQLAPELIDDTECELKLNQFISLNCTPYQCLKELPAGIWEEHEATLAIMLRRIYSKRQLQEVMTEFWLEHFNVFRDTTVDEVIPTHVNTIRKYALSSFHTLLTNVVKSGALLSYLDNVDSSKYGTNQNLAREFMELHTLGVGNYSEADVQTVAEILTGWSLNGYYQWPWTDNATSDWGKFQFYPDRHISNKSHYFLGNQAEHFIPAGGQEQFETVMQRLALHPATARHLCRKLARKFLNYEPTEALVEAAANSFLASNGSIKTVLRYLLTEARFRKYWAPKLKRPMHLIASGIRSVNGICGDMESLFWEMLHGMKNGPLLYGPPDGYPDELNVWIDNMRPRFYMGFQLPTNRLWDTTADVFSLVKGRVPSQIASAIDRHLTGGRMSYENKKLLVEYMGSAPNNTVIREAWSLGMVSPEFQLH